MLENPVVVRQTVTEDSNIVDQAGGGRRRLRSAVQAEGPRTRDFAAGREGEGVRVTVRESWLVLCARARNARRMGRELMRMR